MNSDRDLQAVIFESFRSAKRELHPQSFRGINSHGFVKSVNNRSTTNTLLREGIVPVSSPLFNRSDKIRSKSSSKTIASEASSKASSKQLDNPQKPRVNTSNKKVDSHHMSGRQNALLKPISSKALRFETTSRKPIAPSEIENTVSVDNRILECQNVLLHQFEHSIVSSVMQTIIRNNLGVKMDDIAALPRAKKLLQEAVILPLLYPDLFTGIREPWKGILLFGPPGTGKTMLAKAISSTSQAIFFNCSASSLVNKYRGDSEKVARCLFQAARLLKPSIIFLDEVDAIAGNRGDDGEHEASRRLKTEFFAQMDGLESDGQRIMVLAATNSPWDLDQAMRRRLEKRLYIPLPDASARLELLRLCLRDVALEKGVDFTELAERTEGFSGADLKNVCREAAMAPLRRVLSSAASREASASIHRGTDSSAIAGGGVSPDVPAVTGEDFRVALSSIRPSVSVEIIVKYEKWNSSFGAT